MTTRFKALDEFANREIPEVVFPSNKTSDYFGKNVFSLKIMKEYMPKSIFKEIENAIQEGSIIDRKIADMVADSMKTWAVSKGATHYTHWFQPLTGSTAEKHDAFVSFNSDGTAIESFSGSTLAQQEPDASSFPSGGLRETFEARGYTAWDPSSPAFIFGTTLCIPTIFVSYTGESLDHKVPLLKAIKVLNDAAVDVCQMFDKDVIKVNITLGAEQEYFLVDRSLFLARPDLIMTGRTLMGHTSAKDQQLEDHYFGSIPTRVAQYMKDFQIEAYKLGIPLTTRHNEVAPNQFEVAPFFEELNLANDHNMMLMDLMNKVARRHNFKVLFHEKPFKGINGSGKHNNWSMLTNTGVNLLSPGKNPKSNLQFISFLVCIIKAVFENQDLLRANIASNSNRLRLGAAEAPPSIMSIFLGKTLSETLDNIEKQVKGGKMTPEEKTRMKLDVSRVPEILLDTTDRNRTSPFAFTGNRFEFRAVGSSQNCAAPMHAVILMVADKLIEFKNSVDSYVKKGLSKDEAIYQVIKEFIIASKNVRFEGNGYSDEWVKEAEKRGLTNIKIVTEALKAFVSKKSISLYKKYEILKEHELHARYEIELEKFFKKAQIESRILADLSINHIIPIAYEYQNRLIENVKGINDVLGKEAAKYGLSQLDSIKEISEHIQSIYKYVKEMVDERKKGNNMADIVKKASQYELKVCPLMDKIREHVDNLELIVDDKLWPLPKYRELLFSR